MSLEPYDDPALPERFRRWIELALRPKFEPPRFIAPTLLNSWVNYGAPYDVAGYYKDPFGRVHLRGLIKNGTVTTQTPLFTLPLGFRPLAAHIFAVVTSPDVASRIDVRESGEVRCVGAATNATYLSLAGISFAAV